MDTTPMQACDERCLVARCHQGDREAFAELYRRHVQTAIRFASRVVHDPHLAEDVAQQALLKAFLAIGKFRQRASFRTWLYRLTVNEAFSLLRRRSASESPIPLPEPEREELPLSPEETVQLRDLQGTIWRMVANLHPTLKCVVAYKYYHGLTDAEIAGLLGCPPGTVKSRLHRARHQLRAALPADLAVP